MRESLQKLLEGMKGTRHSIAHSLILSLFLFSLPHSLPPLSPLSTPLAIHSPAGISSVLQGLDASSWLRHVHLVMEAGTFIAKVKRREKEERDTCTCIIYKSNITSLICV